ncbi:rhodanese-like domain-containing protein [Alkalihalophilus marmarensis]|uniref:rhodanese-like domain-containing protein n=1 Tax=Alkalihalophilus marmarensis TaxID=521377 RepID=UPI002DB84826|nr:rhodanese-like domain-containing protein [Alkalihalophilus marmarensis]MEC2071969.1 rhodanese-like domain-containing protein [Alkalihalophilus marmarensis]
MELIIQGLFIAFIVWFVVKRILPANGVKQITTEELRKELTRKDVQLVDVRTQGEFSGRKIKQAKNIPLHELKGHHNELSKDKEVIVICQSGMRSNKACGTLKKLGYSNITNVKGGMSAWRG